MRFKHAVGLVSVGVFLVGLPVTDAADLYWRTDGTSGTWTGGNWSTLASAAGGNVWTTNSNVIFSANSTVTFASTSIGNVTVNAGKTVTVSEAGTLTTGGNVRTFDIGSGAVLNWASQDLSSAAGTGFIKNGEGVWNMGSNANAYTGGFTLNAGTVIVTGIHNFGDAAMAINGGTIQSSGSKTFTPTSLSVGGNFEFTGSGTDTWNMPVNLNGGTRIITQNASGADRIFSGKISNGGLTKSGSGILTLSAANDYSGVTTISQGTLKLSANGSIASSSEIAMLSGTELDVSAVAGWSIASGQKLTGAGTVKGSMTINGTHAPLGTQAVTGDLTYGIGSIFEWDLSVTSPSSTASATIQDAVTGGGNTSTLSGSDAVFRVVLASGQGYGDPFWTQPHEWTGTGIFNNFTEKAFSLSSIFSSVTSTASAGTQGAFSLNGNTMKWVPVPELGNALAGLLLGAGLLRRSRPQSRVGRDRWARPLSASGANRERISIKFASSSSSRPRG